MPATAASSAARCRAWPRALKRSTASRDDASDSRLPRLAARGQRAVRGMLPGRTGGVMRRLSMLAMVVTVGVAGVACGPQPGTLQASAGALGAATMRSIEFSGTGRWYQFGQAPAPSLPWPQFDVNAYRAAINFETPAARVQMTRKQTVEAGR